VSPVILSENEALHRIDITTSDFMWPGCVHADEIETTSTLGWRRFRFLESRPPKYFGRNDLLRISCSPILSVDECMSLIHDAETDLIGWHREVKPRYGVSVARQCSKLPVDELNWSYTFVNSDLLPRLIPEIKAAFPQALGSARLRLQVCRILKYDAARGFVELGYHYDGPLVTAVVALNDPCEYDGGGTMIEDLNLSEGEVRRSDEDSSCQLPRTLSTTPLSPRGTAVRLEAGHVLLHPGAIRHGGAPITRGVRYALAMFFSEYSTVEHVKHCEQRAEKTLSTALMATDLNVRAKLIELAASHYSDAIAFGAEVDLEVDSFLSKHGYIAQA
jgi:hypothetical protein